MNPGPLVFLAAFFAVSTSWFGFVLVPELQLGSQQPVEVKETGLLYPSQRPGLAKQGEEVYRANGCFYCHSQQVRPKGYGVDVERGWGGRPSLVQSVSEDYLFDRPAMPGSQRVGPDLKNIGLRQPDVNTLLKHLYDPQSTQPGSTMPPYRFLFVKRKLRADGKFSADALQLDNGGSKDYEIVPTDAAKALAAYLLSLNSAALVYPETPPFPAKKKAAATAGPGTNAPAAATNSLAVSSNAPAVTPTNAPVPDTNAPAAATNAPAK